MRFPVLSALGAVLALILFAYVGAGLLGLQTLFGVVIPYVALGLFIVGFIYRVVTWAASPVPFHIPTVCGQQRSLSWIKADNSESPYTSLRDSSPEWRSRSSSSGRSSGTTGWS